jgi:formylglycine-generating enzyme required for sulfatase activity
MARSTLRHVAALVAAHFIVLLPISSAQQRDRGTDLSAGAKDGVRSFDLGNGATIEMIRIKAGTFTMGSTNGDPDERPIHRVTISKAYYLGKFEVTQRQWVAVMGTNPSNHKGDDLPVETVSWEDIQNFLLVLNSRAGGGWRLPTEAEWEYACRAGSTGDYGGPLDQMAWYENNSDGPTHPVGHKQPNAWGVYDTHGNVWEWCQDWYDRSFYKRSPGADPVGPSSGSNRVLRGGGRIDSDYGCRSACRNSSAPSVRFDSNGFRLARTADVPALAPPATEPAPRPSRDTSVDLGSGVRIELAHVRAGRFLMGSTDGGTDETPAHRVTISKPFLMGKYEVTQGQWKAVMGSNPSNFTGNDDLPVERVSWDDCQEFIRRLNATTGGGWRLPTEAEWEYACRAGSTGGYAGDVDAMAWYGDNSGRQRIDSRPMSLQERLDNGCRTHPVGAKQPNAWGLYDMHGNVWEWCSDWYGENYYAGSPGVDPVGPTSGAGRVIRGGSWNDSVAFCRSAFRDRGAPSLHLLVLGLRLARTTT